MFSVSHSRLFLFCFVNIVFVFSLINDSIAQQQGTESAKEFLEHHRDDSIPHGAKC
jgi:hypothetical protein